MCVNYKYIAGRNVTYTYIFHRRVTYVVTQGPHTQKDPALGLISSSCHLEILHNF